MTAMKLVTLAVLVVAASPSTGLSQIYRQTSSVNFGVINARSERFPQWDGFRGGFTTLNHGGRWLEILTEEPVVRQQSGLGSLYNESGFGADQWMQLVETVQIRSSYNNNLIGYQRRWRLNNTFEQGRIYFYMKHNYYDAWYGIHTSTFQDFRSIK